VSTTQSKVFVASKFRSCRRHHCGIFKWSLFANIYWPWLYTPTLKQTVLYPNNDFISEWRVFNILDTLRSTATGLDGIPSWFLRVAAPIFCSPITQLFNLSLSTSTVPRQWKQAWIRPVSKVTAPTQHSDFRPISITTVLTRALERMIVQDLIYPALQNPTTSLVFHDQFAFRPSGSTTAAMITLLHKVTHLLLTRFQ